MDSPPPTSRYRGRVTADANEEPGQGASMANGARRLRRTSSADQVAAYIRRSILAGVFVKGERLNQNTIASELGLSRIPVREAVIALDREGWVRFEANRGATVATLGADEIRDHYELRGLIFGLVACRVATNATDDELKMLAARLEAMRDAPDAATFSDLNDRFLGSLLRITNSPRLTAALLVTPSIIPEGFFDVVPNAREIQTTGAATVIRAMRKRDAEGADRAMRALLSRQGEAVIAAFAASGLVEQP